MSDTHSSTSPPTKSAAIPTDAEAVSIENEAETTLHDVDNEIASQADEMLASPEAPLTDVEPGQPGQAQADESPEQNTAAVESASEVEPASPATDEVPGAAPAAEPAAPAVSKGSEQGHRATAVRRMLAGSVRRMSGLGMVLLVLLNAPMRLVPDSLTSVVNWFALSLLLWVPAVWILALYVI